MPLEDLVQYVSLPLDEKREYHTVAGLLMEYLQHVPQEGEEVKIDGYVLRTLQVESHRVQKVQIVPPVQEEDAPDYEV
jgi:CBS domain containing-hemolysin-like protein